MWYIYFNENDFINVFWFYILKYLTDLYLTCRLKWVFLAVYCCKKTWKMDHINMTEVVKTTIENIEDHRRQPETKMIHFIDMTATKLDSRTIDFHELDNKPRRTGMLSYFKTCSVPIKKNASIKKDSILMCLTF